MSFNYKKSWTILYLWFQRERCSNVNFSDCDNSIFQMVYRKIYMMLCHLLSLMGVINSSSQNIYECHLVALNWPADACKYFKHLKTTLTWFNMVATGQGKVREFQKFSGKFEILKMVRENEVLSGKTEHSVQNLCTFHLGWKF